MDLLSLLVSLKLSVVTTLALIGLAAPLAYMLAYLRFPGKSLVEALLNLPMAMPPTVMGFYLMVFMGPQGVVGRAWANLGGGPLLFTFSGIVIASMACSLPFAVQPMKAAFQRVDRRLIESAYVLGISPFKTFIRVIIPQSVSGIVAGAVLVFLHCMGAFGMLLMIGGSVPGVTKVASISIYEAVETMNYQAAGVMSFCFIPISYGLLLLLNKINER